MWEKLQSQNVVGGLVDITWGDDENSVLKTWGLALSSASLPRLVPTKLLGCTYVLRTPYLRLVSGIIGQVTCYLLCKPPFDQRLSKDQNSVLIYKLPLQQGR